MDVNENIEDGYRNIASAYDSRVKSDSLDHRYIEHFLSFLKPGGSILDLGCGTGNIAHEMQKQHDLEVTAVDISDEMIGIAKKQFPDLKTIKMDIRKLDFPLASFNGVFANYSLIHVPEKNVEQALADIHKLLMPSGYLYLALQEPVNKMEKDGYFSVVYKPEVKLFINLFTESEIRAHLEASGFNTIWVDRRAHEPEMEFPFNKLFVIAQKV